LQVTTRLAALHLAADQRLVDLDNLASAAECVVAVNLPCTS
jgi:hypothetical protein